MKMNKRKIKYPKNNKKVYKIKNKIKIKAQKKIGIIMIKFRVLMMNQTVN